jgi:hypothetical protein
MASARHTPAEPVELTMSNVSERQLNCGTWSASSGEGCSRRFDA